MKWGTHKLSLGYFFAIDNYLIHFNWLCESLILRDFVAEIFKIECHQDTNSLRFSRSISFTFQNKNNPPHFILPKPVILPSLFILLE
jgi:hypothetical protein